MTISRRTLFDSDNIQIGLFEVAPGVGRLRRGRAAEPQCDRAAVRRAVCQARGAGPSCHGHAEPRDLFPPDAPYRISFPGGIGDRAITLRFADALAPEHGRGRPASQGLLPANAMMLRNLLWTRLEKGEVDEFEAEALGLDLLDMSL